MATLGVHSETGRLREVIVHRPDLSLRRLTPDNCKALLFDDVLWVENAKRDHLDFVQKMRDRAVDVVEMHDLLTETVTIPEGKKWILDNQVVPDQVGLGLVDEIRSYLEGLPHRKLAETLIGGLSTFDFPESVGGEALKLIRESSGVAEYLPRVDDYLKLATGLVLAMGLCFQLPVILTLLGMAGLIGSAALMSGWRYAVVGVFGVAAVVTPPDPVSMLSLAVPICLLYFVSIWCVKLVEGRRPAEDEAAI